jgi:hypothetical protein
MSKRLYNLVNERFQLKYIDLDTDEIKNNPRKYNKILSKLEEIEEQFLKLRHKCYYIEIREYNGKIHHICWKPNELIPEDERTAINCCSDSCLLTVNIDTIDWDGDEACGYRD